MWRLFVIPLIAAQVDVESLRFVHVIWRHGARSPSHPAPGEEEWTEGRNQLTRLGAQQQYRLGQWLRQRYDGFLSQEYKPDQVGKRVNVCVFMIHVFWIFVRSSDYDRTLMSAQWNMAGMFPPTSPVIDGLPWQAIPIHTTQKWTDKILWDYLGTWCEAARLEELRLLAGEESKRLDKEYNSTLEVLTRQYGFRVNPTLIGMINDPLVVAHTHNRSLPSWVTPDLYNDIQSLSRESNRILFNSPITRRLRGGPILGDILDRFEHSSTSDDPLQYYAYSGHDVTIVSLLSTLDIVLYDYPDVASALILEMHERNNTNYIEMYYKSSADSPSATRLFLPACPEPCSLQTLRGSVQHYIPSDWQRECRAPLNKHGFPMLPILLVGGLAAVAWVVGRSVLRSRNKDYQPLLEDIKEET